MSHSEFDVFISYNRAEQPAVLKLATQLRDRGLKPWLDVWNLVAGEPWLPDVERALKSSAACAVIVGPSGLGGVHQHEMWTAIERSLSSPEGQRFRVIPVLLPHSTLGDRTLLPSFLTRHTWIEFQETLDEPATFDAFARAIQGKPPTSKISVLSRECPYRGLAHFEVADAPLFFGREELTSQLLSRLSDKNSNDEPTRFLAIFGASGSGKSSLARAGLLASLKQGKLHGSEHWPIVICRPESRPLETLAAALANAGGIHLGSGLKSELIAQLESSLRNSPDGLHKVALSNRPADDRDWRLVVFVDQFEELFTLNPTSESSPTTTGSPLGTDRTAYVNNLLNASSIAEGRTIVILTMRADFYGKCTALRELATAVSRNQELIGPMGEDELRRAIETPARLSGRDIESGLVDLLVREVAQQPGALPLLQYALAELWNKSNEQGSDKLTMSAYRELGGWEGALKRRADAVLATFRNTPQEKLCRELFLRLVQPGEGTEDTKRLVRWGELQRANASEAVALEQTVRTLVDNRLITTGGDIQPGQMLTGDATVEVVHEALIRGWDELRKWLDTDRAALRTHRQLTEAANEWAKSHPAEKRRDTSLLYTGSRLAAARELSQRGSMTLNDLETQFVDASTKAVSSKKRRTVQGWVGTIAVIALLAIFGSIIAFNKQNEAVVRKTVESLETAEPAQLPEIIKKLGVNPALAATFLHPLISLEAKTIDEKRKQLHARLAMVVHDKSLVEPLLEELLNNKVAYIGPVRQQLRPYAGELTEKLCAILRDESAEAIRRFHAAAALADYIPASDSALWTDQDLQFVAGQLVSANAEFQPLLRENLRPICGRLLPDLERIFSDPDPKSAAQRLSAANAFADYAVNDIPKLSQLLAVATPEQHSVLYPIVAASPAPSTVEDLGKIVATPPSAELGSVERIGYGQRRANAAVTLLRMGEREKVVPVFDINDDPEALTQFIFRCRERGIGAEALLDCLQLVSVAPSDRYPKESRYALLLALGEFTLQEIPASRREALLTRLADWYRHDPSSGVHGAAGWLLRHWGQAEVALQVDQTPLPYAPGCEWFTLAITVTPDAPPGKSAEEKPAAEPSGKTDESGNPVPPQDDVKPQAAPEPLPRKTFYYTFIVFPAGDYNIGSVNDETNRAKIETRHPVKLMRPFALLDREITFEELIAFSTKYTGYMQQFDAKPADAGFGPDWYDSVGFCRWLSHESGLLEDDQSYADPKRLDKEQYPHETKEDTNWAPRNWPLELGRRGFRLPTESEWEVACRAGTRTTYGFGSDTALLERYGWFSKDEKSVKHVHPTRELRPSYRGLFDMHGNLYEWTHDWYTSSVGADAITDPLGAKGGSDRVLRGGGWNNDAAGCRTAYRVTFDPTYRTNFIGFRLALSPFGVSPEAVEEKGAEPSGVGTEGASAEQRPEMP